MEGAGTEGSSWESKGSKYDSLRGEKNTSVHISVENTKTCTIPSSLVQEERESQNSGNQKRSLKKKAYSKLPVADFLAMGGV